MSLTTCASQGTCYLHNWSLVYIIDQLIYMINQSALYWSVHLWSVVYIIDQAVSNWSVSVQCWSQVPSMYIVYVVLYIMICYWSAVRYQWSCAWWVNACSLERVSILGLCAQSCVVTYLLNCLSLILVDMVALVKTSERGKEWWGLVSWRVLLYKTIVTQFYLMVNIGLFWYSIY